MNNIFIDHILIAVSDEEFTKLKRLTKENSKLIYKKIEEKEWSWEAIYAGLGDNIYLEIVLKSKYSATIGLALSSHGNEQDLLGRLKIKYPGSVFETEKAKKDGVPWYDAYFSNLMESETSFLWFMSYHGEFRGKRQRMTQDELPEIFESITLNLSINEIDDFKNKVHYCGLKVDSGKHNSLHIKDEDGRFFSLNQQHNIGDRVLQNFQ